MILKLKEVMEGPDTEKDGVWIPILPLESFGILRWKERIQAAFAVLKGEAVAFEKWMKN